MNVNSDFYEMLVYASLVEEAPFEVTDRLSEMRQVIDRHYAVPDRPAWFIYTPDWTPHGPERRPATAAQTAGRLIEDRTARDPTANLRMARHLTRWAFAEGWDRRRNALHFICKADADKQWRSGHSLQWWAQLELLKAAAYLSYLDPGDVAMAEIAASAKRTVTGILFDERHGGSRQLVRHALPFRDRFRNPGRIREASRKGTEWKDASHDARTLMRLVALEAGHVGWMPTDVETDLPAALQPECRSD